MRDILGRYNKRFGQRASKERLLGLLVDLEGEVSTREGVAISSWLDNQFLSTNTLRNLIDDVHSEAEVDETLNEALYFPSPDEPAEDNYPILPLQADCSICMETLAVEEFPEQTTTELCSHDLTVCRSCLTHSIDSQIPDVAWDQIQCPECTESLPYDVVKTWASPEAFQRHNQISRTSTNITDFAC